MTSANASSVSLEGDVIYKFIQIPGCIEPVNRDIQKQAGESEDKKKIKKVFGKINRRFIDSGLEGYCHLVLVDAESNEYHTYIEKIYFDELWKINPHELREINKKHWLKGDFDKIEIKGVDVDYYKGRNIEINLIDGVPKIRK